MSDNNPLKFLILLLIIFCTQNSTDKKIFKERNKALDYHDPMERAMIQKLSYFQESNYIDEELEKFKERYGLKGISVSIIKDEKLILTRSYGLADVKNNLKTNPENVFRLASVSKLITAVAIMKLVEEGKLSLNDKVFGKDGIINDEKYLKIKDPQLLEITVLHLLNHSGGWTQRFGDPMFNPLRVAEILKEKPPVNVDSYIKFAVNRRLHFKPGTAKSYSNMGYMFLGEVIKRVTKKPYEEYVSKEILKPIGIKDMNIANNLYEERFSNEVTYYDQSDSCMTLSYKGDSILVSKMYGGNDIKLLGSAGGWVASSVDLAKFLVYIDGFDKVKDIISKTSFNQMTGGLGETLGWKEIYDNGLVRTGTFAGTVAVLYRGNDGFQWVFLSNTSTWKGPYFSHYIVRQMRKIINKVQDWPEIDLFRFY
jgi:CubicO group peptidase (beta-lactamase class C family)